MSRCALRNRHPSRKVACPACSHHVRRGKCSGCGAEIFGSVQPVPRAKKSDRGATKVDYYFWNLIRRVVYGLDPIPCTERKPYQKRKKTA